MKGDAFVEKEMCLKKIPLNGNEIRRLESSFLGGGVAHVKTEKGEFGLTAVSGKNVLAQWEGVGQMTPDNEMTLQSFNLVWFTG